MDEKEIAEAFLDAHEGQFMIDGEYEPHFDGHVERWAAERYPDADGGAVVLAVELSGRLHWDDVANWWVTPR
jgi:hypothetical protein